MKKILCLAFLLLTFILYSQDLVKEYEPPEVIEGSELNIGANTYFDTDNFGGESRSFSLGVSPDLTKFRYSEKLNYIINLNIRNYYNHYYHNSIDEYIRTELYTHLYINGALNYYFKKNTVYTGINAGSETVYSNTSIPSYENYIAPLFGYGKIVNAVEVARAKYFEQILIEDKVIENNLKYRTLKKLVELFDKRNNGEFIYKFKEDNEIEFFS